MYLSTVPPRLKVPAVRRSGEEAVAAPGWAGSSRGGLGGEIRGWTASERPKTIGNRGLTTLLEGESSMNQPYVMASLSCVAVHSRVVCASCTYTISGQVFVRAKTALEHGSKPVSVVLPSGTKSFPFPPAHSPRLLFLTPGTGAHFLQHISYIRQRCVLFCKVCFVCQSYIHMTRRFGLCCVACFIRRALSAAQGVAKLAVQTVERSQGGGDLRQQPRAVPASEASSLARRLRAACAAMEVPIGMSILAAPAVLHARSFLPWMGLLFGVGMDFDITRVLFSFSFTAEEGVCYLNMGCSTGDGLGGVVGSVLFLVSAPQPTPPTAENGSIL